MITFEDIKKNEAVKTYVKEANNVLGAMGYTEHSFGHVKIVSDVAASILIELGFDERKVELAKIAGYLHDIGNIINRNDHAQNGAIMAFHILNEMGMEASEIALIVSAIGNHDEPTAYPVNEIAAAIIIGDKTDVRRSRVRNRDIASFDIHDRVNFSVEESNVLIDGEKKTITLYLSINLGQCTVMDYFEIFLNRMVLCKKAANFLNLEFKLIINKSEII